MAKRSTRAFVEQRRASIAEVLRECGRMGVIELAERFGVSTLTIRRDLDALERQGLAVRRYGEAVMGDGPRDAEPDARASEDEIAKVAIAQAAAELVRDHELLFVNTSSTALSIIDRIEAQGVVVVTNSSKAASLPIPPNGMILMTGGEVRPPRGVLSGEFALANIRNVCATTCFLGCAGISSATGVTSTTQQEASVNSLMLERSAKVVLLADASKLHVDAGFSYAALNQVDLLITDAAMTDDDAAALEDAGIHEILRVKTASLSAEYSTSL